MLVPLMLNLDWEYADSTVVCVSETLSRDVTCSATFEVEAACASVAHYDVVVVESPADVN